MSYASQLQFTPLQRRRKDNDEKYAPLLHQLKADGKHFTSFRQWTASANYTEYKKYSHLIPDSDEECIDYYEKNYDHEEDYRIAVLDNSTHHEGFSNRLEYTKRAYEPQLPAIDKQEFSNSKNFNETGKEHSLWQKEDFQKETPCYKPLQTTKNKEIDVTSQEHFPKLSQPKYNLNKKLLEDREKEIEYLKKKLKEQEQRNSVITSQIKSLQAENNRLRQTNCTLLKEQQNHGIKLKEQQDPGVKSIDKQHTVQNSTLMTKFTQTKVIKKLDIATQLNEQIEITLNNNKDNNITKFTQTKPVNLVNKETQYEMKIQKQTLDCASQIGSPLSYQKMKETQTFPLVIATKGTQVTVKKKHKLQQTDIIELQHQKTLYVNQHILSREQLTPIEQDHTSSHDLQKSSERHINLSIPEDSGFGDDLKLNIENSISCLSDKNTSTPFKSSCKSNHFNQLTPLNSNTQNKEEISTSKIRMTSIIILNLSSEENSSLESNLRTSLKTQQLYLLKFLPAKFKGKRHAILKLPCYIANQLYLEKKLTINNYRYSVVPYFKLTRCIYCKGLDHSSNLCIYRNICCICGGNHSPSICVYFSQNDICTLCNQTGLNRTDHNTSSFLCPSYQYYKKVILKQLYDNHFATYESKHRKHYSVPPLISSNPF